MNKIDHENKVLAIRACLARNDKVGQLAITTAIVRLYEKQTADERQGGTREHNGRGFNAFDGAANGNGTYMAHYALGADRRNPNGVVKPEEWDKEVEKLRRGQPTCIRLINGHYIDKARKMLAKYVPQLATIALEREARLARELQEEREAIQAEANEAWKSYIDACGAVSSCNDDAPPTLGSPRFPFPTSERPINVSLV